MLVVFYVLFFFLTLFLVTSPIIFHLFLVMPALVFQLFLLLMFGPEVTPAVVIPVGTIDTIDTILLATAYYG
jgi:hypothetical protein